MKKVRNSQVTSLVLNWVKHSFACEYCYVQSFKSHTQMLCHKIVHITFQIKYKYVVSMILQISVQAETRAASSVW